MVKLKRNIFSCTNKYLFQSGNLNRHMRIHEDTANGGSGLDPLDPDYYHQVWPLTQQFNSPFMK